MEIGWTVPDEGDERRRRKKKEETGGTTAALLRRERKERDRCCGEFLPVVNFRARDKR